MIRFWETLGRWSAALSLVLVFACMGPPSTGSSSNGPAPPPEEGRDVTRVFRVQIGLFSEKAAADSVVGRAVRWWEEKSRAEQPAPLRNVDRLPVDVHWRAPYYRVRIGPFVARDRAEAVLQSAQEAFPEAFIAPETVRRGRSAGSGDSSW
jgi:hypothetical protein